MVGGLVRTDSLPLQNLFRADFTPQVKGGEQYK
ncbi:hypothetical protein E2C01_074223 [Portunus trituberculatus]|uniref:Uncharacterized protein n=1 Tax=Portunus trituberculatus TaxID=210409 RepID=A0A5B7I7H0_PORTR|nr:hypothetical protein [Portunus trituberculatus]